MSLKVRCPKCRGEVADPPDLRAVACPCGALFDGRGAPPAYWIAAGLLCALVLVALWITAWQNRERKLAGRYGIESPAAVPGQGGRPILDLSVERREAAIDKYFAREARLREAADVALPAVPDLDLQDRVIQAAARHGVRPRFFLGDQKRAALRLGLGEQIEVEHFFIAWLGAEGLRVLNPGGLLLARYAPPTRGWIRRWHELELRCVAASPQAVTLELELKPGSSCFGPGDYRPVRAGLRIDLEGGRSVTVTRYDAARPELHARVTHQGENAEIVLTGEAPERKVGPLRIALEHSLVDHEDSTLLKVEEP